jgi:prophage tail gpP-like protein
MADLIEIKFDNKRFNGFQTVKVRESVDELCASVQFTLARSGKWSSMGITANTLVQVLINGELVTTIRPGKIPRKVTPNDYTVTISGRSLARELVDCQFSKTLKGLKLGEIVKAICGLFKVPVKIDAATELVPDFSMQCEVPANALINAARVANLLLYPTPEGGLILTAPSDAQPVATLVYGVDFTEYEIVDDFDMRFSEYVVKSFDYESGGALKGSAHDAEINFFRPLHIVADRHGHTIGNCKRRAELERNRRIAKAHAISFTVCGFGHANGRWAINTQVRVVIPDEDIDGVFLIGQREFGQDEKTNGSTTHMSVLHRNAFIGEPPKKMKRSAGARK